MPESRLSHDLPPAHFEEWGGHLWFQVPDQERYVHLGICPIPRGTWQTFRYHVLHGLIMGYPPLSVLRFAWRNRRSFEDD